MTLQTPGGVSRTDVLLKYDNLVIKEHLQQLVQLVQQSIVNIDALKVRFILRVPIQH
jgi:hypothetical protein